MKPLLLLVSLAFFATLYSCNDAETMSPKTDDLKRFDGVFLISNMQVEYDKEITDFLGPPSPEPIRNGTSLYSTVKPSIKTEKKGEIILSGIPLLGCTYAKVNGDNFEIYYQDTKKRPEYIGFRNFMVYPMSEHIMVQGTGSIVDGAINNLYLHYTIQGLNLMKVTATFKRHISNGGYQANIGIVKCE